MLTFAQASAWMLLAGPLVAQLPGVGLSSVGAQAFANEDLLFYVPEQGDSFGYALATGDFNGDGIDDLATGVPIDNGLAGSSIPGCGAVVVRYGDPGRRLETGLADTFLNAFASGSPDPAEFSESYGAALTAGDFNGDGIDDLAIGIPQNRTGAPSAGGVEIHYGRAGGIQLVGEEFLRFGASGIPGAPANGDRFGLALASGNFNGDAYDDLAVGAPDDDLGTVMEAGSVMVFHGSANGLLPFSGYAVTQDSGAMEDVAERSEHFGYALAAGDFDGSGHDDLAIGVPWEDGLGAVQVVFGGSGGLNASWSPIYRRPNLGWPVTDARFGWALASGDFDGDGRDDLAVGDPQLDFVVSGVLRDAAGGIHVLYGATDESETPWFDLAKTDFYHQGILYGNAAQQANDSFGEELAAGDFDGDGFDDLAVGHSWEAVGGAARGGATILTGSATAGLARYFRFLSAGNSGMPGVVQDLQLFGGVLATGDFDDNGFADLVFGVPYHDVPGIGLDVGAVYVVYGSLFSDGLDGNSSIYWSATTP